MKNIKTFEQFINESTIDEGRMQDIQASIKKANDTEFTLDDFKNYFGHKYSYISHDVKDKDIQKFIDDSKKGKYPKVKSLSSIADLFQDYLVSQGIGDVQEKIVNENTHISDFLKREAKLSRFDFSHFLKIMDRLKMSQSDTNVVLEALEELAQAKYDEGYDNGQDNERENNNR